MASSANNDRIASAITKALSSDSPPAHAGAAAAAAGGGAAAAGVDPKKLFCDNWDTVKAVLGFLRSVAPAFLKPIIDMVIRAGDAVKATICR
jgi:3-oxoacyl-ACP reductase-like protein